jgi:alpha-1,2-mannosyltransferase
VSEASRVAWPTAGQKGGLAALAAAAVLFGGLVELRSAFLSRRMGDLTVFVRTAWAVRAGEDIYAVTDDNGYHYHYPPLLAILLTPLADPPAGAAHDATLPYPVTVALWYVFNLACLALSAHWLAGLLEEASADPAVRSQPAGCRRWWALRTLPVLACLPPVGHTLMRGQVSLLLLLLLSGFAAALFRGRPWRAGLWLAGAICLKVIPALLVLVPLLRRDGRCLAACALGMLVGLGVVPVAVLGPSRTAACYAEWADVLVRPGLGAGGDSSARDAELLNITATDSQSFQAALHNLLNPDRDNRPPKPAREVRLAHWAAGGLLTAVTLLVLWRRRGDRPAEVAALGALVVVMILTSPVCHLHYFALAIPLVAGTLAASWERSGTDRLAPALLLAGVLNVVANTLPNLPGMQAVRDGGLATAAALLVWGVGLAVVSRTGRPVPLAGVPARRVA